MKALAIVMLLGGVAGAHPLDVGYLRVDGRSGDVAIELEIDHTAAAVVLKTSVDDATVRARAAELAAGTYRRSPITTSSGPCTWTGVAARLEGRTVVLTDAARCGEGARRWSFPFVTENRISTGFALLVKEVRAGTEKMTLVDGTTSSVELAAPPVSSRPWWPWAIGAVAVVAGLRVCRRRTC